jgi:hypothetical protein
MTWMPLDERKEIVFFFGEQSYTPRDVDDIKTNTFDIACCVFTVLLFILFFVWVFEVICWCF